MKNIKEKEKNEKEKEKETTKKDKAKKEEKSEKNENKIIAIKENNKQSNIENILQNWSILQKVIKEGVILKKVIIGQQKTDITKLKTKILEYYGIK